MSEAAITPKEDQMWAKGNDRWIVYWVDAEADKFGVRCVTIPPIDHAMHGASSVCTMSISSFIKEGYRPISDTGFLMKPVPDDPAAN